MFDNRKRKYWTLNENIWIPASQCESKQFQCLLSDNVLFQGRAVRSVGDRTDEILMRLFCCFHLFIFSGCYEADRHSLCVCERGDGQLSERRLHVRQGVSPNLPTKSSFLRLSLKLERFSQFLFFLFFLLPHTKLSWLFFAPSRAFSLIPPWNNNNARGRGSVIYQGGGLVLWRVVTTAEVVMKCLGLSERPRANHII